MYTFNKIQKYKLSSLSKIRDRLGEETFKKKFDRIIEICIEKKLVDGSKVMMDGSIIKADAALRSMVDRPQYGENLQALNDRQIESFVPRFNSDTGDRVNRDSEGFTLNKEDDYFICPVGHQLHPIEGSTPEYKRYRIKGGLCRNCPLKETCLTLPTMKTRNSKDIEMSIYHKAI